MLDNDAEILHSNDHTIVIYDTKLLNCLAWAQTWDLPVSDCHRARITDICHHTWHFSTFYY